MLKLTTTHIDEIRRYFLALNEEERVSIQKNIKPQYLSAFLLDLKKLFNAKFLDEIKLAAIAKSMGGEDYLKALKEIQQDYYCQLAELYISDISNPDIEALIKFQNAEFLLEVDFQKELKIAFQLNERASLKKNFQQLDRESDIGKDELSLAFTLIERQKLKEQFQKIENERERGYTGMVVEPAASYSKIQKDNSVNSNAPGIPFAWKPLAIAASVIALILTTTFIIFKNDNKQADVVSNKPESKKTNIDTNKIFNPVPADANSYVNLFPSDEIKVKVLKEESLGFAVKDEYVTVQTYYMGDSLKVWKGIGKDESLVAFKDPTKGVIDSLHNLRNMYLLKRDTVKIYLLKKQSVKFFNINAANYLQIGKLIYECKKSKDGLPLKRVTDKQTLQTIDKILFNETD